VYKLEHVFGDALLGVENVRHTPLLHFLL